jgi:hypothetical protein
LHDPFVEKLARGSTPFSRLLSAKTKSKINVKDRDILLNKALEMLENDAEVETSPTAYVSNALREKRVITNRNSRKIAVGDDTEKTLVDSENRAPTEELIIEVTSGTSEGTQDNERSFSSKFIQHGHFLQYSRGTMLH